VALAAFFFIFSKPTNYKTEPAMEVVILAAGKGTRMNSSLPKVLHQIGGKPMLAHVIEAALELGSEQIHVVVGFEADKITQYCADHLPSTALSFVAQTQQLGTGHAVQQAVPQMLNTPDDEVVLILYGDVPLIQSHTLGALIANTNENTVSVLTAKTQDPTGLGRILRDDSGHVVAIVEEKDATDEQRKIEEINTGIMALPAGKLKTWLANLGNNNQQGEYYLTDVIAMAVADGCSVIPQTLNDEIEALGVNDKIQLALLERYYQNRIAGYLLQIGVTLRDPNRLDIRGDIEFGKDVEIDINCLFEGKVRLGNGVSIGANCVVKNSTIGDNVQILPGCNIDGAVIAKGCVIGPTARLRPGTDLGEGVKIGNFVETKNTVFGKGSKANHLSYIGDAAIGDGVNIGAGAIFCNYDGANKHKSTVGNNVFIGSNSVLVAPATIEDNGFIAAGSTITSRVKAGQLAIGRAKQRNIEGWKRPSKK
jgi:bifunctional UDP-N-acetylglucosamine pyrophosphorylase/glucosamine-1-phosphate N-acetyltransferase